MPCSNVHRPRGPVELTWRQLGVDDDGSVRVRCVETGEDMSVRLGASDWRMLDGLSFCISSSR